MTKEDFKASHEAYAELLFERNKLAANAEIVNREYGKLVQAIQGKIQFKDGALLIDLVLGYIHSLEAENKNLRAAVCKESPEMETREAVLRNGN